jgi:capsid protein
MTWERVPRETSWGRPIVVHDFDHDRASQHRGTGIFTPVVQRLKMLVKYDATELESAVLNAIFGAYIESPYDPQLVEQAMGTSVEDIASYQDMRKDFHNDRRLTLGNGARMPIMFPGEKVVTVNAARPNSNFPAFESAVLRNTSSALGISESQLTQDWSKVNYSSARSALLEAWKTLTRRRIDFATGFAQPILGAFIEELHDTVDLPFLLVRLSFWSVEPRIAVLSGWGPAVVGSIQLQRRKARFWGWMLDCPRLKLSALKTWVRTGRTFLTSVSVRFKH